MTENKIKAVLFDLDGTLLDTLEDLTDSLNQGLNYYGVAPVTMEKVRQSVGNGAERLLELILEGGRKHALFDECVHAFKRYYSENRRNKTMPYDGIMDLLTGLKEKGFKLAVVSNKFDKAVKALADDFFPGIFMAAIGESEGIAKKPAPDMVFKALALLNMPVNSAVLVGDSETDVATAKNAGIPCIGVTWGFRDMETLKKAGADYMIGRPEEIWEAIKAVS